MAGMNDREIFMKGYNSNDPFVVMGRNGVVLKQPRPGVMFLPDVTEYSLGKGTVVKDSDDAHSTFNFRIRYKSTSAPVTDPEYASDGDYRVCTYRGSSIYRQTSDMSLHNMDSFVTSEGSRGIDEQHGYYWLFPYELSGSTHGNYREIGHGPDPYVGSMYFRRENNTRRLYLLQPTGRIEVYVVVSMKDQAGLMTPTSVLDNNVRGVYLPFSISSSTHRFMTLNKVRTWSGSASSTERMQLWAGFIDYEIVTAKHVYAPVLSMHDGASMIGDFYSDALRVNVSTTYLLTGGNQ